MKYGAKYIRWAPVTAADTGKAPVYGEAISLGGLQKVSDSPSYAEAKGYEDDALAIHVTEFTECPVDVEIGELTNEVAAKVLGAELSEGTGDLHFGAGDTPPDGGMGFITKKLMRGSTATVFQGVFYPLLKASMQGVEYNGKQGSITLGNSKLRFLARRCETDDWKIQSKDFATEKEAAGWVDGQLAGTGSGT